MHRDPLSAGYVISMANGGVYTIKHLIGEGGFSLIYAADTSGGTSSVVLKEFYPSQGARRDSSGKVVAVEGNESRFKWNLSRFEGEGHIGGRISEIIFQTIPFLKISEGYAVMKRESEDMRCFAAVVDSWKKKAPVPFTGNPKDCDPVFPDMVRVRYALRMIESVLVALDAVHQNGYLHLDISAQNLIWAGREVETGENCEAFLADFGCAVEMNAGAYDYTDYLSYSPGFSAPEIQRGTGRLTPATDLYSVGMLLYYLCVGESALEITHNRERQLQRELAYLAIPNRIRKELNHILLIATNEDMDCRYASAADMFREIRSLRLSIPVHPLNRTHTDAFTLYSLRSMLTGSEETGYSWADELRDRRNLNDCVFPESVYTGLSWKQFDSDDDFLQAVLPEEIYDLLCKKAAEYPDRDAVWESVLFCNYDLSWKREICHKIEKYGTRRLLQMSCNVLDDENAFFVHQRILFQLLGDDGNRLHDCYNHCSRDIRNAPYVGLAMFILFALLGPEGFKLLLPSPTDSGVCFFAL